MIIGSDLMDDLGIVLDYYDKVIRIKNPKYEDSIPMKKLGMLQCNKISQMIYDMHTESPVLQQEEERQSKILDCNYSKVDLQKLVSDLDLSRDSKRKLIKSLSKFQKLFSGGLGKVELDIAIIEAIFLNSASYANKDKTNKKEHFFVCNDVQ